MVADQAGIRSKDSSGMKAAVTASWIGMIVTGLILSVSSSRWVDDFVEATGSLDGIRLLHLALAVPAFVLPLAAVIRSVAARWPRSLMIAFTAIALLSAATSLVALSIEWRTVVLRAQLEARSLFTGRTGARDTTVWLFGERRVSAATAIWLFRMHLIGLPLLGAALIYRTHNIPTNEHDS